MWRSHLMLAGLGLFDRKVDRRTTGRYNRSAGHWAGIALDDESCATRKGVMHGREATGG